MCGGVKASHLYIKLNETEAARFNNQNSTFSGRCMYRNWKENRPYLDGCGDYQVWTDTGFIKGKPAFLCYYPAIDGLEEFYKWYPNATLMLITRNTPSWQNSVSMWSMGTLVTRWNRCNVTGWRNRTASGIQEFYEWHKRRVRSFAKNHPSLTYIEAELESPETASLLESATGIPSMCWADCDPKKGICRVQQDDNEMIAIEST